MRQCFASALQDAFCNDEAQKNHRRAIRAPRHSNLGELPGLAFREAVVVAVLPRDPFARGHFFVFCLKQTQKSNRWRTALNRCGTRALRAVGHKIARTMLQPRPLCAHSYPYKTKPL